MGGLRRDRGRSGTRSVCSWPTGDGSTVGARFAIAALDTTHPSPTAFMNRLLSLVVFFRHASSVALVTISRITTHVTFWMRWISGVAR